MDEQASELRLTFAEHDPAPTPQFDEHFHWEAALESSGFAGRATFVTSGPQFEVLVEQLGTLDATLLVPAEWRSGEGDHERFWIRVSPNGHTGRLLVEVSLTAPVGETRLARRVTGVFGIMPNTLREFVHSLRAVPVSPVEGTEVRLAGDREADV